MITQTANMWPVTCETLYLCFVIMTSLINIKPRLLPSSTCLSVSLANLIEIIYQNYFSTWRCLQYSVSYSLPAGPEIIPKRPHDRQIDFQSIPIDLGRRMVKNMHDVCCAQPEEIQLGNQVPHSSVCFACASGMLGVPRHFLKHQHLSGAENPFANLL